LTSWFGLGSLDGYGSGNGAVTIATGTWGQMSGKRTRVLRPIVVAAFVVPTVLATVGVSSAAPSREDVQAAKAELDELNRRLSLLVEDYNQANERLGEAQARMAGARRDRTAAETTADRALSELSDRAVAAYTGMGSQLDVLLGAESFAEFSDRLQFMGALAQSDADLALAADSAAEQARRAASRYREAAAEEQELLDALAARKAEIEAAIAEQRDLYEQMDRRYRDAVAARQAAAASQPDGVGASSGGGGGAVYVPAPNASAAQIAVGAAYAAIGTPYAYGSSDPNVGFDCSGLTSWAWAQAGIYLPHSSAMQYSVLPHVPQDQLAPGDLLFFYSPISHVAIYVGGGSMIDASYPGPGGEVRVQAVYWQYFVGAGRPG
jgi:cell wall-associated NlpC family hydrolase